MKRRTFLGLATGGTIAAVAGATVLFRPGDEGKPYSRYFSDLNQLLKREGPGRPLIEANKPIGFSREEALSATDS